MSTNTPTDNSSVPATITAKAQECSKYIRDIYAPLCFNSGDLKVSFEVKSPFIHFTIECSERDDGIIIGRKGATINSVRLLVHAYSKANLEGTPCIIEAKDHRQSKFNPLSSGNIYRRK